MGEKEFKETLAVKIFYSITKFLGSPFVKLIWVREVKGSENLPKKGAFIVASNHSSYFDFISLISVFPRKIYFLAAEKFFKGKIWGLLVRLTGQIKVERESGEKKEVYSLALSVLRQGKILGIFPEGTRSPDGKINRYFTGVAKFALSAKVPVVPVGIIGAYKVLPRQNKFPKFKKVIEIKIGKQMDFSEYYNREQNEELFKEITDKIMENVAELYGNNCCI